MRKFRLFCLQRFNLGPKIVNLGIMNFDYQRVLPYGFSLEGGQELLYGELEQKIARGEAMHPFITSKPGHGNVVFNFTRIAIDQLRAFALGYHEAGKTLVNKILSSGGYADYEGYPILFLYRHSLELYIKFIIYKGAQLLGLISDENVETERLFTRHELTPLLPAIKVIFENMEWGEDFGIPEIRNFNDFAELIKEIKKIDPRSYNFRYPIDRGGEAALPPHFTVNVIYFGKNMDKVLDVLEGAVTGIEEHLYASQEALYSIQQLLGHEG